MGMCSTLQIIFIVLKVLGLISWSWWIVFVPLFIQVTAIIILGFFGFSIVLGFYGFSVVRGEKQ